MTWLSDSGREAKCQVPQKFIVDPGGEAQKMFRRVNMSNPEGH